DPAHALDACGRRFELALAAHHDAIALGVDRRDVEPPLGRDAEPAPLAHRVAVDAAVAPEHAARGVDDLALTRQRARLRALHRARVVAVGNEADLLALGLLRGGEPERARALAHLGLGHRAERKVRGAELRLREPEQEVGLVLVGIDRAPQPAQPGLWVAIDARVVPRGHRAGAEYLRALEQVLELEALIARHARDWRASREIGARELIDHLALEALAVVRDVEAHAE